MYTEELEENFNNMKQIFKSLALAVMIIQVHQN